MGKFVSSGGWESARDGAEDAVQEAFRRGVELARHADLPNKRIRELFNDCLSELPRNASAGK